jgi:hypothetical protein
MARSARHFPSLSMRLFGRLPGRSECTTQFARGVTQNEIRLSLEQYGNSILSNVQVLPLYILLIAKS